MSQTKVVFMGQQLTKIFILNSMKTMQANHEGGYVT